MALKFYSSIRIDIRRAEAVKLGSEIIGNTAKIKIVKNKVAAPYKSCVIEIVYGKGISKSAELLDLGEKYGLVGKSGNWYQLGEDKIGNGREAAKGFLEAHPDIADKLESDIRVAMKAPEEK